MSVAMCEDGDNERQRRKLRKQNRCSNRELEMYTTQPSASLSLPRLPELQNPKTPGPKQGDSGPKVLKVQVPKDR